jgi:hypothetical protein
VSFSDPSQFANKTWEFLVAILSILTRASNTHYFVFKAKPENYAATRDRTFGNDQINQNTFFFLLFRSFIQKLCSTHCEWSVDFASGVQRKSAAQSLFNNKRPIFRR